MSQALDVAVGDVLRVTQNSTSGGRRFDNGALVTVTGFARDGGLLLDKGALGKDFGHIAHGYVATSHASQGKTVDRVFIAQGSESFRASSREQFYVSVARGRERATLYTDDAAALREQIHESGVRGSVTELLQGEVDAWARPRSEAIYGMQAQQARRQRHQRYQRLRARVIDAIAQEERAAAPYEEHAPRPGTRVRGGEYAVSAQGAPDGYGYAVER